MTNRPGPRARSLAGRRQELPEVTTGASPFVEVMKRALLSA
ncbi:MAG: hypothetical protein QOE89_2790 [Pseudonocardiales bacterium]|nr:hypothetical protein [Pseudonocardiales bacterium]